MVHVGFDLHKRYITARMLEDAEAHVLAEDRCLATEVGALSCGSQA